MTGQTTLDAEAAHRHFSAACFNDAWTLIEKTDRSADDDERMIALNQASLWHWSQRPDCADRNRAIGYWQASRIRSVLGHPAEAARYAELCLHFSRGLAPFHLACAHEAVARAALLVGDRRAARANAMRARVHLQAITDDEERDLVVADLATLGPLDEDDPDAADDEASHVARDAAPPRSGHAS